MADDLCWSGSERGFQPLSVAGGDEFSQSADQLIRRIGSIGSPDCLSLTRCQRLEAGQNVRVGYPPSRFIGPAAYALQRIPVGDVSRSSGESTGPAQGDFGRQARRYRRFAAIGEDTAQRGGEQTGTAAACRQVGVAATLLPQALGQGESIGTLDGDVNGVGDVDAPFGQDSVEAFPTGSKQRGDLWVGVGFVPQGTREDRRAILVAGVAERAVGVDDPWFAAFSIVFDQLELETSDRFVVTDHFQYRRFFLIADVQAILQQQV